MTDDEEPEQLEDDGLEDDDEGEVGLPADPNVWPGATAKQAAFLTAYVQTAGQRREASRAARISRTLHYHWLRHDQHFAQLFAGAQSQVVGALEDEATRRAFDGVDKPVFYQGRRCGRIREYSDTLLMFLLRGAAPEKYREQHEHRGEIQHHLKFDGRLENLLALYHQLTREGAE